MTNDITLRATETPTGVEIEMDATPHLRLDAGREDAAHILGVLDVVIKGFAMDGTVPLSNGLKFEVWNDDGQQPAKRFGLRVSGHGMSVIGRVDSTQLLNLADDLEEVVS